MTDTGQLARELEALLAKVPHSRVLRKIPRARFGQNGLLPFSPHGQQNSLV